MDKYLSVKLKAISFVAMILVVILHANNFSTPLTFPDSFSLNFFVQFFFTEGISRIAVPVFFGISGYLFFLTIEFHVESFIEKYRKRFKSLVIPYLLWSAFGILLYLFMQSFAFAERFFVNDLIRDYDVWQLMERFFWKPVPYQFWFIKDLVVLVFISPLIAFLNKYTRGAWLILVLVYWFESIIPDSIAIKIESLLFFGLGGLLSYYKKRDFLSKNLSGYAIPLAICWVVIVLVTTHMLSRDDQGFIYVFLYKTGILIGVVALWSLYDFVYKKRGEIKDAKVFSYSFFIFAFHEPLLTVMKSGLFFVLGKSENTSLIIYFIAPVVVTAICIVVAMFLERKTNGFYKIITGGR